MRIAVVCYLLLVTIALGTPQVPDVLHLEDETVGVYGFELSGPLRRMILETEERESEKYIVTTTSNYDGFYAVLRIAGEKLFLEKLQVDVVKMKKGGEGEELPVTTRIDVPMDDDRTWASWFTGELRCFYNYDPKEGVMQAPRLASVYHVRRGKLVAVERVRVEKGNNGE